MKQGYRPGKQAFSPTVHAYAWQLFSRQREPKHNGFYPFAF